MHRNPPVTVRWMFTLAVLLCAAGCERDTNPLDRPDPSPQAPAEAPKWETAGDGYVATVDDPERRAALAEAMQEAHDTAEQARMRWRDAAPHEKDNWLIKWAAPVRGDGANQAEYVWIRPERWSAFRVEGRLVSEPRGDIGAAPGELVGFPIEQLADWVYLLDGTMRGPRQGGFTIEVLERYFGVPRS